MCWDVDFCYFFVYFFTMFRGFVVMKKFFILVLSSFFLTNAVQAARENVTVINPNKMLVKNKEISNNGVYRYRVFIERGWKMVKITVNYPGVYDLGWGSINGKCKIYNGTSIILPIDHNNESFSSYCHILSNLEHSFELLPLDMAVPEKLDIILERVQ